MNYDVFERLNIPLPSFEELDQIENPRAIVKFEALFWDWRNDRDVKFEWFVLAGEKRSYELTNGEDFEDYYLFGVAKLGDNEAELGYFHLAMDIYNNGGGVVEDFEPVPLNQLI